MQTLNSTTKYCLNATFDWCIVLFWHCIGAMLLLTENIEK